MTSHVSEIAELITNYDLWSAQLVPTSMEDRYFVANNELAICFFHHHPKFDTTDARKELQELLSTRHPSGIHPICAKSWKKISCSVKEFKNGHH